VKRGGLASSPGPQLAGQVQHKRNVPSSSEPGTAGEGRQAEPHEADEVSQGGCEYEQALHERGQTEFMECLYSTRHRTCLWPTAKRSGPQM
jgi:hypothetical protein